MNGAIIRDGVAPRGHRRQKMAGHGRHTFAQYTDMLLLLGECRGNATEAARQYRERFPLRPAPNVNTIRDAERRMRESGSVRPRAYERGRERNVDMEEQVLEAVGDEPSISTRDIARGMGISPATAWRVLHVNGLHPYHVQRVQELHVGDCTLRLEFCQWLQKKVREDAGFVSSVLFTDECCFTKDGIINLHNVHTWADANPHSTRVAKSQQQFSVNVWAGILGEYIFGPVFLPARLNGANYLDFLINVLPGHLEDIPLGVRLCMYFMHDGAPAHYSRCVRAHLNRSFPQRWIGRGGAIRWPPRSPDLNPLDFFLWGHCKTKVYDTPVQNVEILRQRIRLSIEEVRTSRLLLSDVQESIVRRVERCTRVHGGHIEHLL